MSRVCEITGKKPVSGCNVSHSHRRTKRRFLPNLQKRRYWAPSLKRFVSLLVSVKGMRIIDKVGIDRALEMAKKNKAK